MKKNSVYILFLVALVALNSCHKVLEQPDPSAVDPTIWDDEATATLYLNKLYDASLPAAGFGQNVANSDESPGSTDYIYGNITTESVTDYSITYFSRIRNINIAIEEVAKGTLDDEAKARLKGQALFLRAWEYWGLVKLYGGVPLVLAPQNPYEDDVDVARSKTSECIDQIVADLDEAQAGLPASWPESERGRITRGAAAALKGRVLLYWASPQFNPANDAARWQRAYDANKAAKDLLITDGKGLYDDFKNIFINENNKEVIFARLFDFTVIKTHAWENTARPRIVGGDGGTAANPTLELVNAFPMQNGLSITDPASGYDSVHYWKSRDPRFEATIAWNGAVWNFTGFPTGRRQWQYYYYDGDGNQKSVETSGPTTTGYYTRKAINANIEQVNVKLTGTDWVEIRYAEVLLNLAECANETGITTEAYTELKAIRARAGIDAGDNGMYGLKESMGKEEMATAIMNERQVEFAFENKRYWDLRRRNLFESMLNGTRRYGIRTVLRPEYTNEAFMAIRDTVNLDTDQEKYFTTELWLKDDQFSINYQQPLYNFFGIPTSMLDRSPAVTQTNGWGNGGFDPLQ